MAYLRLTDPVFDRALSLREAYAIMERFLAEYHARGESSTVELLTDVGIVADGTPGDPAQIYDFLRVAGDVLADPALSDAGAA